MIMGEKEGLKEVDSYSNIGHEDFDYPDRAASSDSSYESENEATVRTGKTKGRRTQNQRKKGAKQILKDCIQNKIKQLEGKLTELEKVDCASIEHFDSLPISKLTLRGLKKAEFKIPTAIQRETLIHSLRGIDVVGEAKTGSGKTLAFIIPMLELLYRKSWTGFDGIGAIVVTPTRELAYQIYEVLSTVGLNHDFSAALIIGGKDLKYEWDKIHACNILITTPGRLMQHMTENPTFDPGNLQILILDEADKILSMGFAETMNCILEQLPKSRQTLLFSATQTRNVQDLIRAGCNNPVHCFVSSNSSKVTPTHLCERYVVVEEHDKLMFLWSFIKHHQHTKNIIFVATCKQVTYFTDIIVRLDKRIVLRGLHGGMNQLRRLKMFEEFSKASRGILICTDVASRGLDIPKVDWVIQLDCPEDSTTYIHRAGRTARNELEGNSLLVLTPSQVKPMLTNLRAKKIELEEMLMSEEIQHPVPKNLRTIVAQHPEIKERGQRVFKLYLKTVMLMGDKNVFDITTIHLDAFARSLGLAVTPRVRALEKYLAKKGLSIRRDGSAEGSSSEVVTNNKTTLKFNIDPSDDDDDDLFTKPTDTNKYKQLEEASKANEEMLKNNKTKKKVYTKYDHARSLINKKLRVNDRLVFDDDGNRIKSQNEIENLDEKVLQTGIDINKKKELLEAEEEEEKLRRKLKKIEFQKQRREERKVEKRLLREGKEESESEEDFDLQTKAYIDELPDPGKIYGTNTESCSDGDSEVGEESNSDDPFNGDEDENFKEESRKDKPVSSLAPTVKRKLKAAAYSRKRLKKLTKGIEAEDKGFSSLELEEKEKMALFLLGK